MYTNWSRHASRNINKKPIEENDEVTTCHTFVIKNNNLLMISFRFSSLCFKVGMRS